MKKLVLFFYLLAVPMLVVAQEAGEHVTRPTKKIKVVTSNDNDNNKRKRDRTYKTGQNTNQGTSARQTPNRALSPVLQNLVDNMVYVSGGTFTMGATPEQGG